MKKVFNEIDEVAKTVESVVTQTDTLMERYRRPVLMRFLVLFSLLVGFGAAATFYGFERIIAAQPWLNNRPWLILGVGLPTLALTGKLYKKLGQ